MPTARKPLRTGDVVRYGKAKAQVRQPIVQNFPHPSTAKFAVEQYVVVEIVDTTTGLAASLYSIEENRYFTIVSSACIYLRVWRRMLGELARVTATRRQPVEIQAEWLTASEFGDEAFVLVTQL